MFFIALEMKGGGDLHLEVDHIRARPTIKECEAQQPDVLWITQSGFLGNETDTNEEIILFHLIVKLKKKSPPFPMERWVTHSERLMTKTLQSPLDGWDCSAEQITMMTNAEAQKKKKREVFSLNTEEEPLGLESQQLSDI